jgi:hypothetical protein
VLLDRTGTPATLKPTSPCIILKPYYMATQELRRGVGARRPATGGAVVESSELYVQLDAPAAVVDAVREILDAVRKGPARER